MMACTSFRPGFRLLSVDVKTEYQPGMRDMLVTRDAPYVFFGDIRDDASYERTIRMSTNDRMPLLLTAHRHASSCISVPYFIHLRCLSRFVVLVSMYVC